MKKSFLLVITLLCSSLLALAEMTIYVYKKDGTKIPYVASVVDSIGFVDVATPEAVDLGLPSGTKWANMNVGANKPEDCGDYFAWGETSPKAVYNWQTYKWCNNPDGVSVTKYNKSTSFGVVDNKTILELTDDAANANWGGDWRLPTDVEAQELFNTAYCSWSMITQNGVTGYKVISKINGNSIFLPAAGFYNDNYENGSTIKDVGSAGVYMTCILGYSIPVLTECIFFDISTVNAGSSVSTRSSGHTVRPVLPKESYYTVSFDANGGEGSMPSIKIEHGKNIVLPANTFTKDFSTFVRWSTTADGTGGWYDDQAILNPNTNITLYAQWEETLREYVDLGLPSGTLWATCNVGANSPEEYGDYFAWGETESKAVYDWETYKWCNGSNKFITKYFTAMNNSDSGSPDNNIILDNVDDVANVKLGGRWRMPTYEEIEELLDKNNCERQWVTRDGVNGILLISKHNGTSIFLPAGGYRDENSSVNYKGSDGYYWTSSLSISAIHSLSAVSLRFYSSSIYSETTGRDYGFSIRPVQSKYNRVFFHPNGGEGNMQHNFKYEEEEITLPNCDFYRHNYKFVSWNTSPDGTGISYSNGDHIYVSSDMVLYAQWEENPCEGSENGYEWVDLGLSVRWATCNLGANSPEGVGNYYAWGELTEKTEYKSTNYNYNEHPKVLPLLNDVANVRMGGNWRMPTIEEYMELKNNCIWEWVIKDGVDGFRITSMVNQSSIFLPVTGYYTDKEILGDNLGYYSSSSAKGTNFRYHILFLSSGCVVSDLWDYMGMPIRPVLPK